MAWNDFDRFPWSIPLGSVLKIPVRLHLTFFIVWIAQTLGSLYYGGWYVLLSAIVLGPVLLLTILVHELGHCLAARSVGGTADSILLWPLGGLAFIGYNTTYLKAIWVAAAGPLTHLPMVAIWVGLLFPAYHGSTGSWHITLDVPYVDSNHFGHALVVWAILLNIALFLFNLLVPAYPLDGGRILANLLMLAGCSMRLTAIITVAVAAPIALGIIVFGIIKFQMVSILVGAFILYSTFQLFLAIRRDKLTEHPLFASTRPAEAPGGGGAAAAATATPAGGMFALSSKPGAAPGPSPGYPAAAGGGGPGHYPGMPASYYTLGNAV